jgi:hypothetical protein
MQIFAFILFWVGVAALLFALILASLAAQAVPRLRESAVAFRSGAFRSAAGAFVFQVLSGPAFILLVLVDWLIQGVAGRMGATGDTPIYVALPIGVPALLLPPAATLVGAYIGFRAGWHAGKGRNPADALAEDAVVKRVRWLGVLSPSRW